MKAKKLCMTALLLMGLTGIFISSAHAALPYVVSYNAYGFGVHKTYRPYEPSYYLYSPLKYSSDPCDNWEYGNRSFRTGFMYGGPKWTYSPALIPPYPESDFRCCYNCGKNCADQPCCSLCNYNGCCHDESMKETESNVEPEQKEQSSPNGSESVRVEPQGVKVSPVSYQSSQTQESMPRLSNVDVRDSRGAIFTIWAPNQARVYVNGYETRSVGSRRKFVSFGLKPGMNYEYNIEAIVERDGKMYQESKKVVVQAGAVKTVAFAFPELNTRPSEDFEY